ncbi:MAG: alpha/beta fold hydrolase [Acidimicrobiales bacterium]|jgi:2-succinyl-6-hydroxy-2,4-cyclohexadiene-1-carboxylate synthase
MPRSDRRPSDADSTLHIERRGEGPPLVLAHGFTQTGRVWGGLDDDLARDHRLTSVDLPGHGGSSAVAADLPGGAALLGEAGGEADYLGYSMGARFCLHLALSRPDLVRRLVLVSGTAGIDDPGERAERRRADAALADRLDPGDGGRPADTVEEFVIRWVANPLFGTVPGPANGLAERMRNTASGLATSLRLAGAGTQEPLWDRLGRLDMPVLVVTGSRDEKFTALGLRLVQSIGPGAAHVVVADADHAPHLQHPGAVAAAVRSFLDGSGDA